jgi:MoaA/NifB/PqqE/SkfB family radical SAM enzyme
MSKVADGMKQYGTSRAVKAILALLPHLSDANIIRLTRLAEKIVANPAQKERVRIVREKFESGHPSMELARRLASRLSPASREKFARNLFVSGMFLGTRRRNEIYAAEGWKPPFFFVISPTMACNLKCVGCYAGEYAKKDVLTTEEIDRLFTQGKELGIYFVTVSGGEPFIRKDLLDLWKKHDDMYFLVYTNGLLIDDKKAELLGNLGNVAPAVSVEGFEEHTDLRRGPGVFKELQKVWKRLRENGVLFGFSATATRENTEIIYSDRFIDFMIEQGALFGWYFQYIPIGKGPDTQLMATPKQRDWARERLKEIRATKPIVLADFWNDGHLAGGCIAGGRVYFHINVNGDVEPCVFVHFATDNIKNTPLKDALQSKLFRLIRENQPYSRNLMCPCMIIDNPSVLRSIVKQAGARATHPGAETIIGELAPFLDEYAQQLHSLWDPVWQREFACGKNLRGIDTEVAKKL